VAPEGGRNRPGDLQGVKRQNDKALPGTGSWLVGDFPAPRRLGTRAPQFNEDRGLPLTRGSSSGSPLVSACAPRSIAGSAAVGSPRPQLPETDLSIGIACWRTPLAPARPPAAIWVFPTPPMPERHIGPPAQALGAPRMAAAMARSSASRPVKTGLDRYGTHEPCGSAEGAGGTSQGNVASSTPASWSRASATAQAGSGPAKVLCAKTEPK